MTLSILVPVSVFSSVSKRLARLSRDCGVELTVVPGTTVMFRRDRDRKVDLTRAIDCARVTVGDMPRVNGFKLIGKLMHTSAGNIVSLAPDAQGEETPEEWRNVKPSCDHCKTARRRNETFMVRCPDGSVKRVGRNCLADFLQVDPSDMVALSAFQDALRSLQDEDEWERGGSGGWTLSTLGFVAYAVSSIAARGFFKRQSSDQSTADHAVFLSNPKPGREPFASEWTACQPTEEHKNRAAEVIDWVRSSHDNSDYMHNLRVACASDVAPVKLFGLLASAPQAYNRHLGFVAERAQRDAARAAEPDAGHVGAVGERIEVTATIVRIKAIDSDFGTKLVVSMKTTEGHNLVTFTTGTGVNGNDTGKTFIVRGTVKKHTEYQGKAQTDLSRCAFKPTT
jgi:hypothetical protein